MYQVVYDIINHAWVNGDSLQSTVVYVCGALIIILTCVFIDMIYRIFSHFWHG